MLLIFQLEAKNLVFRFGPIMNTKVAFNTTATHTKLVDRSSLSGKLKLGIKLKTKPTIKKKSEFKKFKINEKRLKFSS